jgi:hypothetical protein
MQQKYSTEFDEEHVVEFTDAVVQPLAVVVEHVAATVALLTVLRVILHSHLTNRASLFMHFSDF